MKDERNRPGTSADLQIANSKDPLLSHLNDLSSPAGRNARGQFLAESILLVQRALEDRQPVDWIIYTAEFTRASEGVDLLNRARSLGIRCVTASGGLLGKVTTSRPVPEVAAIVNIGFEEAQADPKAQVVLIAENINNPDNLGMILRTADAAGADLAIIAGADPLHKNCVRAARGAVGRLPLAYCTDLSRYVVGLVENGYSVLGTALDAESDLYALPIAGPTAVIVGNENSGVTRDVLNACSSRVLIPMAHGQDSLNVGVAAGVMLYELYRRGVGTRIKGPK